MSHLPSVTTSPPMGSATPSNSPVAAATSSFSDLVDTWDAVVVGAGPAGGVSALRLAEAGHRVLLVEAKSFPRPKVCGGCLNRRAWSVLAACGLAGPIEQAGAVELERLHLICGRRSADWAMPTMRALSRAKLDEIIARAAAERGATFLSATQARVAVAPPGADWISVQLKHRDGHSATVRSRVVIAADGLAHSSLADHPAAASRVAYGSRIGLGTNLCDDQPSYPAGRLTMVVGRAGYVGITRLEQERLNLAAALTAASLRAGEAAGSGAAGSVVGQMLREAGLKVPDGLAEAQWSGTPALTRESRRWAARRVFLVGDAAGYVEPFTGEGMSWALGGGYEVCQYAELAISGWSDSLATEWHQRWRKRVRRHQTICRGLAWLLRRPQLAQAALGGVQRAPWLPNWIMERVAG